jgi:hypothetical protein
VEMSAWLCSTGRERGRWSRKNGVREAEAPLGACDWARGEAVPAWQIGGSGDTGEEVGGADGVVEDAVLRLRQLRPHPFHPPPDACWPELSTGTGSVDRSTKKMAGAGSAQLLGSAPWGKGRKWRGHGALN